MEPKILGEDLASRLECAIRNAPLVRYHEDCRSTDITEAQAATARDILEKMADEDIIDFGSYAGDKPHEVSVDSLDTYIDLLQLAFRKQAARNRELLFGINILVKEAVDHEHAHTRLVEGRAGLTSRFRVSFYVNSETGELLLQPGAYVYGQIQKKYYLEILFAPSLPSAEDRIVRGDAYYQRR